MSKQKNKMVYCCVNGCASHSEITSCFFSNSMYSPCDVMWWTQACLAVKYSAFQCSSWCPNLRTSFRFLCLLQMYVIIRIIIIILRIALAVDRRSTVNAGKITSGRSPSMHILLAVVCRSASTFPRSWGTGFWRLTFYCNKLTGEMLAWIRMLCNKALKLTVCLHFGTSV